jgi:integrase
MKKRYRLVKRNDRGGNFYLVDNLTHLRESLNTTDRDAAEQILHARLQAEKQPAINLQIARAYLSATDEKITRRTWQEVMDEMSALKTGSTLERWQRAIRDTAFDSLRKLPILETKAEHFLRVLEKGSVATNVFLRRLHNFALDMSWLPWPVLPKKRWPVVRFQEKRAITLEEHQKLVAKEKNSETRTFLEFCWHLGGAQSDIASLRAKDVDWKAGTIAYRRKKTRAPVIVSFGKTVSEMLKDLPETGALFPRLEKMHEKHRAKEFKRRCESAGVSGVTLHSYRYSWAERARTAGMSERHAMEMLGHNSAAVHRAYAKKAEVKIPSLEEIENANK